MKTTTKSAAAPATAEAAAAPAPAPAPSGNVSLSQLASTFKRAPRGAAPATQPAATEPPQPAATEAEVLETETELPAETPAAETDLPPGDTAETVEADPPEEAAPDGAPDLTAAETDAMTDAEFAQYVSQLTENKAQKKMLQRIHRLTWRLKQAEKQPPKEPNTPAQPTPPDAPNQLIANINADLNAVNQALAWVDENPDGGEFTDPRTNKVGTYTAAQVRMIRRNAEQARTELLTERATTLSQMRQVDATARTASEAEFTRAYPAFARSGTPEHEEFTSLAAQVPDLQRFPDWKLWLAWSIEGRKSFEARKAKAKPGAPAPMTRPRGSTEPPAVTTRPAAGAPRVNGHQKAVTEAEGKFQQSGKLGDLALMFSKRKNMRGQPA